MFSMEKLLEKSRRGSRRRWSMGLLAAVLVAGVSAAPNTNKTVEKKSPSAPAAKRKTLAGLRTSMLDMPLAFEFNQGQADAKVKFLTRAQNFTVFLMPTETVMSGRNADVLRMKLRNANQSPKVVGEDKQLKITNYFIGNDRSKWVERVPNFGQVRYRDVYSGIDLVYHSDQRQLEYDFVVKPGADPNQIGVVFQGASNITVTERGELELKSVAGTSLHHKPVVYQTIDGRRKLVQGEYTLANNVVGFKVGEYDRTQPLVIDPTLQVLSFFGGTLNDEAAGIATSAVPQGAGIVFVGRSQSPTLPGATKPGASITWDAFATGLNSGIPGVPDSGGTAILWTSYFGGGGDDAARGVAMDNQGNVYIAGYTNSQNFPGAASPASSYDAFVAKLSAGSGGSPQTTLYGGVGVDQATSIALDYSTFSNLASPASIINPAQDNRVTPNVVIGGFTTGGIGQAGSPTFTLAGGTGNSTTMTPDGNGSNPGFNNGATAFRSCTAGGWDRSRLRPDRRFCCHIQQHSSSPPCRLLWRWWDRPGERSRGGHLGQYLRHRFRHSWCCSQFSRSEWYCASDAFLMGLGGGCDRCNLGCLPEPGSYGDAVRGQVGLHDRRRNRQNPGGEQHRRSLSAFRRAPPQPRQPRRCQFAISDLRRWKQPQDLEQQRSVRRFGSRRNLRQSPAGREWSERPLPRLGWASRWIKTVGGKQASLECLPEQVACLPWEPTTARAFLISFRSRISPP